MGTSEFKARGIPAMEFQGPGEILPVASWYCFDLGSKRLIILLDQLQQAFKSQVSFPCALSR